MAPSGTLLLLTEEVAIVWSILGRTVILPIAAVLQMAPRHISVDPDGNSDATDAGRVGIGTKIPVVAIVE
jgi:hypothetical protein